MMLARCKTAAMQGLEARPVLVEVDLAPGLPGLQLVGLADAAVQEARERVRSAIRHSSLKGCLWTPRLQSGSGGGTEVYWAHLPLRRGRGGRGGRGRRGAAVHLFFRPRSARHIHPRALHHGT